MTHVHAVVALYAAMQAALPAGFVFVAAAVGVCLQLLSVWMEKSS
jgi:hypothetical protein